MIYRVCGRAGSGKTEYMLSLLGDVMSSGGEAVVIVPEQQSLDYERTVIERFGSRANLKIEILNFERLPNRTYREYGGLSASCIDGAGRTLIMAQAIENVSDKLRAYKTSAFDIDFVKSVADEAVCMKQSGVTPAALAKAAERLTGAISDKAYDIAVMTAEYDRLLSAAGLDSCDLLTVYASKLDDMPFFVGKTVIIDSFYSFTWQEHMIIDAIARQSEQVYVSLLYDWSDSTGLFYETEKAYKRLAMHTQVKDIILPEIFRFKKKSLAFAEQHIWHTAKALFDGDDGGIQTIVCKSEFEECEAAAATALKFIKSGMRMRDIAVIARSASAYDGIIDAVLKKHGINAFLSSKDELSVKPLSVFLLSAVEACVNSFSLPTVKKYIKSGFCGISKTASRRLIRYADIWDIRGRAWTEDKEWLQNPDGYVESPTDRQKRELKEINDARAVVAQQLSALHDSLYNGDGTYNSYVSALYTHLISCGADKQLYKKAAALRAAGDEDGAQKTLQLWELVISILEQLSALFGDMTAAPDRLLFMLCIAFSEHKVGTIPLFADAVTIGDASMIRAGGVKAAILLGVNDGVFPGSSAVTGLFADGELMLLEKDGIYLGDTSKDRRAKEKLYLYTAVAAPSESLTVIYNDTRPSRPSVAALRLKGLFPVVREHYFGTDFDDLSFSPAAAAANILSMPGEVRIELCRRGLDFGSCAKEAPLCDERAQITDHPKYLPLNPSRLDKYTYCAFSYFGRYVLKLRQNKKAAFESIEIGTFVHKILELFISSHVRDGAYQNPTDDEIRDSVAKMTDEYIFSICHDRVDRRFRYICTRLKNNLFLLLRNISDELAASRFVPTAFEKKLNPGDVIITTPSGVTASLSGTVDRVDEFKKGDKTYVRVIDYKTGATVFSKAALSEGLGLQMFVYLFSLCQSEGKLPAGVLYVPAMIKKSKEDDQAKAADTEAFLLKSFKRSGLLLDDEEVLTAMEGERRGMYLPTDKKLLSSAEELGRLKLNVENYVAKLADSLASGDMSVSPLKLDDAHNACKKCDLKTVCRLSSSSDVERSHSENRIKVGENDD